MCVYVHIYMYVCCDRYNYVVRSCWRLPSFVTLGIAPTNMYHAVRACAQALGSAALWRNIGTRYGYAHGLGDYEQRHRQRDNRRWRG